MTSSPAIATPLAADLATQSNPGQLVMVSQPQSAAADAYRTLRVSLQFAANDAGARAILITSPQSDGDLGAIAANLALAFAEGGQRVALVDANLRTPTLHALFQVTSREGLAAAIAQPDAPLPLVPTTHGPSLVLLVGGPEPVGAAAVASSPALPRVLGRLREMVDVVLVLAPPVVGAPDAVLLATAVDGVVLVVRAGTTRRAEAERAKEQLERVHARILGVALVSS